MPIFVCSLFLPCTVDFHDLPTPVRRPSPPPRHSSISGRNEQSHDVHNNATLFPHPTPPITPSANTDPAEFFGQLEPGAALHFINRNPRSIVRSHSHLPDWGKALAFNQPSSRANQLPPEKLLGTSPPTSPEPQPPIKRHVPRNAHSSRSRSNERKRWGQEWSIELAEQGNGGLWNAIRAAQRDGSMDDILWLGTVGFATDSLPQATKDEIFERLESEYESIAVYVSDSDFDGHYVHYCKTVLWPIFHYQVPDHPKSKAYEDHSWKYYESINRAFANSIVKNYKRGDIIWIHDYHLLLVPKMVRQKLPDAQIGFFLHTAFPSSEVFRCLAMRKPLLEGMLGANLVVFQSPEYQEHFLTTCSRLLVVEATPEGVQLDDHFVNVASLAIGIDPKGLSKEREAPQVKEWIDVMMERYKDKKLIVARDKLDSIGGVRQKLLSYELFLNKYPEWKDKVVLIQVATSTTDNPDLSAVVSDIVTRIDSQHSTLAHQPLVFLRQDIAFSQYLALLSVADVLMVTSLREGMNLSCHEFVICQDGALCSKKHGVTILSEFTGSASIFKDSVFGDFDLPINPWDYQQTAKAIKTALEMDEAERQTRYKKMRDVVVNHTGEYWTQNLTELLATAYNEHFMRDTMSIPRLSVSQLSAKYRESNLRVFSLDYEGTLASLATPANIHLSSPQRVLDALNDLLSDERNIVYVMSGQTPEELERLFERCPGLGIISENGCFVREFMSDEWEALADLNSIEKWKASVRGILQYYHERIEGSVIEERYCSLLFQYRRAEDAEAAARLGGECANHINDACGLQRVHAVPVDKAVLIEPLDWSKASAASHIFNNLRERGSHDKDRFPDFLLVAGDDREDEAIFRWANQLGKTGTVANVSTVSVGKRNTEAMATLTQGTSGLLSVLQKLARIR